ncbi:major outer membrane protein [Helicobacter burdigaliensis]|uniref:major outer membrane protein n=1 Tax=Helicobacter burdigaliensis TaxID=2315334 RepID=UPI000EF6CCB1|nr:major outer membrane protein [Helicobacter burdigaliensis]
MKFLKLSLAASVALGAFSTASFAQPLEEAIKGIDVSGYLRYRYNDDRYDNGNSDVSGSMATHRWRAVADFKTPVVNNVAINLGVWYNNDNNNVNHGNGDNANGAPGTGTGLGSGSDGSFGVRTFYATITPDSTATTIMIGKQELNTPVTNAYDGDRGTGILALNNDIEGLTLVAGAFDSWMINEVNPNATLTADFNSITKPLYTLAGIYNVDTAWGNFGGQLWGFYIQDAVDALVFGELSWKGSLFNAKAQYTYASIDNDAESIFGTLHGTVVGKPKADISESNDLAVIELGANFKNDFQLPLDMRIGYITNFADGTAVSLEDEGTNVSRAGKIWWQNAGTGISTSALRGYGVQGFGMEQDVDVFYANVNYGFIDERLNLGLDFAWGKNKVSTANVANSDYKVEFTEITPTISWKHSKQLTLSTYYAFLTNEYSGSVVPAGTPDQDRNRFRVEAKYSF